MRRRLATIFFTLSFFAFFLSSSLAATLESIGDASIVHDVRSATWTITASGASMSIAFSRSRDYEVTSLLSPSGANWLRAAGPDTVVTTDGVAHAFGNRSHGFTFTSVST